MEDEIHYELTKVSFPRPTLEGKEVAVDEKVYSIVDGWGKIIKIGMDTCPYIEVMFEEGYIRQYHSGGVERSSGHILPSLFIREKRLGDVFSNIDIKGFREDAFTEIDNTTRIWWNIKYSIKSCCSTVYNFFSDIYYWFLYRFHPNHRYNIIKIGKPGFYEYDTQMETAIFKIYCEWWEEDRELHQYSEHNFLKFEQMYEKAKLHLKDPGPPDFLYDLEYDDRERGMSLYYNNKHILLATIVEHIPYYWT